MPEHFIQNGVVLGLLLTIAMLVMVSLRDRFWREGFSAIYKQQRLACWVVVVFVLIALIDSVQWVSTPAGEAYSLLDRIFDPIRERSYSSPLANTELGTTVALKYPRYHLLGTDILGRDVFYLSLKGIRIALLMGGLTSFLAIPLALFFGVSAGYFGKRIDDAVFFVMSVLASVPGVLLLISLVMVLGRSTLNVCIALAVTSWVSFCRIARGETMKIREMDYIHAARLLGTSDVKIIWRHVLPNLSHLIVITFVLMFSSLVLSEAVLSWLGIGVDGSWGQMISQAKNELSRQPIVWWNIAGAGVMLFTLLLAVNMIGDAARDALDPRSKQRSH